MTETEARTVPFVEQHVDRVVDVDGLRLHYTDWNPDGEHTIVMLHGLNVQAHTWDPIASVLSASSRVICPDLRGHGESDWSRDGYWTRDFVNDLRRLVRSAGVSTFALVGHSLGARISIAYAGEHPETLTHLILSDTGPETPASTARKRGQAMASNGSVRGFRDWSEVLEHYRGEHPEWKPVFHELHADYQVRKNWAGKLVLRADPDLFWILRGAGLKETSYLWEMAARADVPALVVYGETSEFMDEGLVARMRAVMPQASARRFRTGHYVPREDPDGFIAAVREFVGR